MMVGADNCLIINSREYLASKAEIEQNRAAYYLFPETKVVSRFIATQLDDKIYPQISFYFLKEQMDALESWYESSGYRKRSETVRCTPIGMLSPVCC